VQLVIAKYLSQRFDHRWRAAAWPDRGDIRQGDQGRIGGIAGLELPAADRHVPRGGVPGEGEQLDEIAVHGTHHGHRLLLDDRALETAGHGLDRHARWRLVAQQRAVRVADQAVYAQCGHHLRRRAQTSLVCGQPEGGTVGRRRRAAVEDIRIALGEAELTRHRELNHHVHQHRDHRADGEQRALGQPLPPGQQDQQEGQHRDDQDFTNLPHVNGHAQGQASQAHLPGRRDAAPQQQRESGQDERLEQHIRHDRLLGLQLIAVQQHGRGSQRGRPAPHATAEQDPVEHHRHAQAQQVLDRRDHGQSPGALQRPQQRQVAKRIEA
jgi:hypothetical protein